MGRNASRAWGAGYVKDLVANWLSISDTRYIYFGLFLLFLCFGMLFSILSVTFFIIIVNHPESWTEMRGAIAIERLID